MSKTHIKLNSVIYSLADFKNILGIHKENYNNFEYYSFAVSLQNNKEIEITISNSSGSSNNIYSENPEKYSNYLRNRLIELWENFQRENIYEIQNIAKII